MEMVMKYFFAFVIGGAFCVIAQILIDKTSLTPARILVLFVVVGVVLGALGLYEPLVEFAGAGATTPLTGFGYVIEGMDVVDKIAAALFDHAVDSMGFVDDADAIKIVSAKVIKYKEK